MIEKINNIAIVTLCIGVRLGCISSADYDFNKANASIDTMLAGEITPFAKI